VTGPFEAAARAGSRNGGPGWSATLGIVAPVAVALACLAATALVVDYESDLDGRATREAAVEEADALADELSGLLETQVGGAAATAAALSVDPGLERATFRRYARSIEGQLPTVLGVGYVRRVTTPELDALVAEARADDAPDFALQDVGPGPEHAILYFNEPAFLLRDSWGLDVRSVAPAMEALERATDTGRTAVSEPLVLAVDRDLPPDERPVGYVAYAPVFGAGAQAATPSERRANVVGWSNLPFRAQDLLELVARDREVQLVLRDDGQRVAAAGSGTSGDVARATQAVAATDLDLGWTLDVAVPTAGAVDGPDRSSIALVVGLAMTALLTAAVALVARGSRRWASAARHTSRTLAESEQRLRATISAAPDLVLVVEAGGTVISASARARDLFGVEPADLIGVAIGQLLPGIDDVASLDVRSERVARRPDGTDVPVEVAGRPFRAGEPGSSRVVVVRDVTERRRADEELRTRSLALERSNEDLEAMATIAAHDLAEPLAVIGGYAELLAQRYPTRATVDEDATAYLHTITATVQRMRAMLHMSSIRGGGTPAAPVDLGDVVEQAIANIGAAIDASGAELRVGPMPTVPGHRELLVQVVQNLLANAVRYRDPSRPLRIEVTAEDEGPWSCIRVADNGIGVPRAERDRIFHMFRRLDDREPGLGIGLAVARRVVELHGGRIAVDETPGGGATFVLRLPRSDLARTPSSR